METHDAAALRLLLRACEEGDPGRVRQILDDEDARLCADSADHQGNCPLHVAAAAGQEATLRVLLARGATLEARSKLGWTPLMEAVRRGRLSCLSTLLEHGASANATNRYGVTALALAAGEGSVGVVRALLERGAGDPGTSGMARDTETLGAVVRILLANVTDGDGATPLMIAAVAGDLSLTRILLDRGARPDDRDPVNGWTALMQAAFHGQTAVVRLLVARGATVGLRTKTGLAAFELSTLSGDSDPELVRFLGSVMMTRVEKCGPTGSSEVQERPSCGSCLHSCPLAGSNSHDGVRDIELQTFWIHLIPSFRCGRDSVQKSAEGRTL
uniref:Uncharacterized protein n=1 Tax=Eptatretus burgeri TaxID=7764 RepID=A0A8C4Q357_EPTBU